MQQMLRGIRDTADAEAAHEHDLPGPHELQPPELLHAVVVAEHLGDVEPDLASHLEAQDIQKSLDRLKITFRYADGTTEKISKMARDLQR